MGHDDTAKEWGSLGDRSLVPSAITYRLKIKSRTVQGGRTGAGACQESGTANGGTETVGEYQGGSVPTVNSPAILARRTGQVEVSAESRADVTAHCFWNWGTTTMFDIRMVNLDVGSYL